MLRIQPSVKTASFVTIHLDLMFVEVNACFCFVFVFFLGGGEGFGLNYDLQKWFICLLSGIIILCILVVS